MLYLLRHSFQNNSFPWWWFLSLNFLWGKEWTFLTNYCTWCIIYSSNCITWVCVCSVAQLCLTLSTLRIIAFLENLKDIVKVHNVSLSKGLQSPGSDRSESVMNMSFKLTSLLTINRGKSSNIKKRLLCRHITKRFKKANESRTAFLRKCCLNWYLKGTHRMKNSEESYEECFSVEVLRRTGSKNYWETVKQSVLLKHKSL